MPCDSCLVAHLLDLIFMLLKSVRFFKTDQMKGVTLLGQFTQIGQYLRLPERVGHAVVGEVEYVCFLYQHRVFFEQRSKNKEQRLTFCTNTIFVPYSLFHLHPFLVPHFKHQQIPDLEIELFFSIEKI